MGQDGARLAAVMSGSGPSGTEASPPGPVETSGMPGLADTFEIPDTTIDLLIVGLGPAGVACALQARRDGLDLLAVSDEPAGGLVRAARRLDNLPAAPGIAGRELADKLAAHLASAGVPMVSAHVSSLQREGTAFLATLADRRRVAARAVMLATGTRPRAWELSAGAHPPHRDARSLPERLAGARVVVIGGGEAALDTALSCADRGAAVTVCARGEGFRAVERLVDECRRAGVELRTRTRIERVRGGPGAWSLATGEEDVIEADELTVCIGRTPRNDLARDLTGDENLTDTVVTAVPGLFLGGDLIRGGDRYVATAAGDGQRAAVLAAAYLDACREEGA